MNVILTIKKKSNAKLVILFISNISCDIINDINNSIDEVNYLNRESWKAYIINTSLLFELLEMGIEKYRILILLFHFFHRYEQQ